MSLMGRVLSIWIAAAICVGCYGSGTNVYTGGAAGTTGEAGTGQGAAGTGGGAAGTSPSGAAGEGTGGTVATTGEGGTVASGAAGTAAGGAGGTATTGAGGSAAAGTGGRVTTGAGGTAGTGAGGRSSAGTGGSATAGAAGTGTGAAGTTMPPSGWGTPVSGGPSGSGVAATVTVSPSNVVGNVGPNFVGFSYEKTHMTNDSLVSTNTRLVALYKLLGSPSIRIGANDVDVSTWGGTGTAPSQPSGQPFTHTITSGMADQLCTFLSATGTKVIYGVNFHSATVTTSASEAAYVMGKCGSNVYGFEIGNEINKYGTWSALQGQWESFATAIVATPGALLVGPGATGGGYSSFTVPFAASESAKFGSKLILLTQHYYVASAGSTSATAVSLQTVKSDIPTMASTMNTAATSGAVRDGYRFGECNSFSGHGQMGVSDTLIGGLWAIDLMFENAIHGSSGVNFHGGETGMDGTKPFYYEPIMENQGAVVQVQPVYYAMLLFTLAGQGAAVSTAVSSTNPNFTAYAVKANGFTSVVLINKNATMGVNATVNLGAAAGSASAIYLQGTPAGSLSAPATAVTLAGAQVTPDGVWSRGAPFVQATSGNTASVFVPAATAALVRVLP
jgi:hypothetical protein